MICQAGPELTRSIIDRCFDEIGQKSLVFFFYQAVINFKIDELKMSIHSSLDHATGGLPGCCLLPHLVAQVFLHFACILNHVKYFSWIEHYSPLNHQVLVN